MNQTIVHDESKTFNVGREDTKTMEWLARSILGVLGIQKAWGTTVVTGVIGILSVLMQSRVQPGGTTLVWIGFLFLMVAGLLLAALKYQSKAECPACKQDYSFREVGQPYAREVETKSGTRRTTTRFYQCSSCGHQDSSNTTKLITPDDE